MDTDTAQHLLAALRESGLHPPERLDFAAQFLVASEDDVSLADQLLTHGLLTPYMHRKVRINRSYEILFGPYLILDKIGEGGMGKVYRAVQLGKGQLVALKVVRQHLITNKTVKRRFKKEAAAAAAFDHPNIVKLYDADEVNGRYYLAMEYVDGIDLARLVKQFGHPPTIGLAHYLEVCEYIRQAALGLQHAHDKGMVHRDIKPSNLLVYGDRALPGTRGKAILKILDMGLVRSMIDDDDAYSTELTRDGTVVGTPDYMSPEQAKNSSTVDARADLYSLGCTFYYMLRGKSPFPDGSPIDKLLRHQLDAPPDLANERPDVPRSVCDIVLKLMQKKPEDRYQTGADVANAIAAVLAGNPMPARRESVVPERSATRPIHEPFSFTSDTSAVTPEPNLTPLNSDAVIAKPVAPAIRLRVVTPKPPTSEPIKSSGPIAIPRPDHPLSSDSLPGAGRYPSPQRAVTTPINVDRPKNTSTPAPRRKPQARKAATQPADSATPIVLWIAGVVFCLFVLIFVGILVAKVVNKS